MSNKDWKERFEPRFKSIWYGMRSRTMGNDVQTFKHYKGRGIKLLWKSYKDFKKDMFDAYVKHAKKYTEKQTTIDRIDTNSHYSKKNCRWATYKQQARNTRQSNIVTYKNETTLLIELVERNNLNYKTIYNRINNLGWTVKKALESANLDPLKNLEGYNKKRALQVAATIARGE